MPQAAVKQDTTTNGGGPDPAAAQAYAAYLIAEANGLERDRATLMERIGKNRDQLRGMESSKALSPDQGDWLEDFYPLKEKGDRRSKEEIERTRKVKEAARKGATGTSAVSAESA